MNSFKKLFFVVLSLGFFLFVTQATYAASLNWQTNRVALSASDFSITANGKTFTTANLDDLHSDNGNPSYTTLEAIWHDQGVEMRVNIYFGVDNGQWKVTEMRTYNGNTPGDWIYYGGFTGGNLGTAYTTGSFDMSSANGGNGSIHFSNFSLRPNFVSGNPTATPTPTPTLQPTNGQSNGSNNPTATPTSTQPTPTCTPTPKPTTNTPSYEPTQTTDETITETPTPTHSADKQTNKKINQKSSTVHQNVFSRFFNWFHTIFHFGKNK